MPGVRTLIKKLVRFHYIVNTSPCWMDEEVNIFCDKSNERKKNEHIVYEESDNEYRKLLQPV